MNALFALTIVVLLTLRTSSILAGDEGRPLATTCPGAAAWRQAHREQLPAQMELRDQTRSFTMPDLRRQLKQRTDDDQRERRALLANPHDLDLRRRVQSLDAHNIRWLQELSKDTGVPTVTHAREAAQRVSIDGLLAIGPHLAASQIEPDEVTAWTVMHASLQLNGCDGNGFSVQWMQQTTAGLAAANISAGARALAAAYWQQYGA